MQAEHVSTPPRPKNSKRERNEAARSEAHAQTPNGEGDDTEKELQRGGSLEPPASKAANETASKASKAASEVQPFTPHHTSATTDVVVESQSIPTHDVNDIEKNEKSMSSDDVDLEEMRKRYLQQHPEQAEQASRT